MLDTSHLDQILSNRAECKCRKETEYSDADDHKHQPDDKEGAVIL